MRNRDWLKTGSKPAPGDLAFVQGFINSMDVESGSDDLATSSGATAWLRRYGLLSEEEAVSDDELGPLREFREGLRALLFANNGDPVDARATSRLNELISTVTMRFELTPDGELALRPGGEGVDRALGELQAAVHEAMLAGTWGRLKACLNDACQWAFYDASRNRSGTWCSMEVCGNRMKVKHHRQRKSSDSLTE